MTEHSALDMQVDGSHYKRLKIQPLELAYLIGATPCFTKLAKYTTRDKGDRIINLDKAIHCIRIEHELYVKSQEYMRKTYNIFESPSRIDQANFLIDLFSDDEDIQDALKYMLKQQYHHAIYAVQRLKKRVQDGSE